MINTLTLNDLLEAIYQLPDDDREIIYDIINKRRIENRRKEIAHNAEIAQNLYKSGKIKRGTLEDLENDLLNET